MNATTKNELTSKIEAMGFRAVDQGAALRVESLFVDGTTYFWAATITESEGGLKVKSQQSVAGTRIRKFVESL